MAAVDGLLVGDLIGDGEHGVSDGLEFHLSAEQSGRESFDDAPFLSRIVPRGQGDPGARLQFVGSLGTRGGRHTAPARLNKCFRLSVTTGHWREYVDFTFYGSGS